ncbi:hypothetical protein Ahy_A01g002811 [Arachis hypogaea]|uniref:Uncharacterized protein n=1 Tax=Arachis hypogaea TaxID=3818 RepID=A0A445ERF0_ARAHY|nr:hypothetical protein Ahy_A01g002811 [Arachis hypogaea]
MERPNGRKIVLRYNNAKQAIGNEAGLLSGVLGLLGSDFGKFSICKECWCKITTKDKVYNEYFKSEQQGRRVSRGKLWITSAQKKDGFYINDDARAIGKRETGRVRDVGFGPTPSQLFGLNSHVRGNGVQLEETQRKLLELQAELEGEKLKRKVMEDEAVAERKKMEVMQSALTYLFQRQGEELPLDIAAEMSFME